MVRDLQERLELAENRVKELQGNVEGLQGDLDSTKEAATQKSKEEQQQQDKLKDLLDETEGKMREISLEFERFKQEQNEKVVVRSNT